MKEPEADFRFYGRRKGKALRPRHSGLIEDLLPRVRLDAAAVESSKTRWLEIGFGGGEHLAHQAALHPDVEMAGAEAFINGVAKLLSLVDGNRLGNVRIHFGDARELLRALPDLSVDRIYLLYPDPWPKARHNKRRFVNQENLAALHRVLKPAGAFMFASDIADYVDWTLREAAVHGGFNEVARDRALPLPDWPGTRYEAKAVREGRASWYLIFGKV